MSINYKLFFLKDLFLKKQKKGFTLFTALVSLLLISITLILIFNMVTTEETYLSLVNDQASISDLLTIADLSRADAFNSFVVHLRSSWEEVYSKEDNAIILRREDVEKDWNSFTDDVINRYFFDRSFSEVFAQSLINQLQYSIEPTGYKIDQNTIGSNNEVLADVIDEIFEAAGKKVDVVNCSQSGGENDECTGSFYLNLDTRTLSDSDYELLPRITVLKYKSNDVIERPILGRQVYKIYMPWRGFQAFRVARRMAYSSDVETSDSPIDQSLINDKGLFNPKLHNTLEQARLGVCDPGTCMYRKDLFKTPDSTGFNNLCSSEETEISVNNPNKSVVDTDIELSNTLSYNLYNKPTAIYNDLLSNVVSSNLNARSGDILFSDDLKMMGDSFADLNILDVSYSLSSIKSKQIIFKSEDGSTSSIDSKNFNFNSIFNNSAGGLGLFEHSDYNYGVPLAIFDKDYFYEHYNPEYSPGSNVDVDSLTNINCYELENITYQLKFKETNPKYKVNSEDEVFINVKLIDSYYGFKFPPTNFMPGLSINSSTGYIEENSSLQSSFGINGEDWICYSCQGSSNNTCTYEEP